jgi:predicted transcriptional regulator
MGAEMRSRLLGRLRDELGGTRYRVARLRVLGLTQRRIARRLRISQPAVSQHLAAILTRYPAAAPCLN